MVTTMRAPSLSALVTRVSASSNPQASRMRRLLKEIASGKMVTGDTTTLEDFSVLAKLSSAEE